MRRVRSRELRRRLNELPKASPPPGLLERIRAEVPEDVRRVGAASPESPPSPPMPWRVLGSLAASVAVVVIAGLLAIRLRQPSPAPAAAGLERPAAFEVPAVVSESDRLAAVTPAHGALEDEVPAAQELPRTARRGVEPTAAPEAARRDRGSTTPGAIAGEGRLAPVRTSTDRPAAAPVPPSSPAESPAARSRRERRAGLAKSQSVAMEESLRAGVDSPPGGADRSQERHDDDLEAASPTTEGEEESKQTADERLPEALPPGDRQAVLAAAPPPVVDALDWQGEALELRGRAAPGARVEVHLGDGTRVAGGLSGRQGTFTLELPRLAAGTRLEIRITPPAGEPVVERRRVARASGQDEG